MLDNIWITGCEQLKSDNVRDTRAVTKKRLKHKRMVDRAISAIDTRNENTDLQFKIKDDLNIDLPLWMKQATWLPSLTFTIIKTNLKVNFWIWSNSLTSV